EEGWRDAVALVGVPKTIEVERFNPTSDRGLDLDVIQDLLLHDLDWVTRLMDEEIVELRAHGRRVVHDKLDEAEATLVFRSGCRVRLRASRVAKEGRRIVRISGDQGVAVGDLLRRRLANVPSGVESPQDPLQAQCRDFIRAIRSREEPEANARVGVAALELVDRVRDVMIEA
ncbi:MAG: Gfo/Idh/MocA family oxidoreductase, partial [Myxococcota bacterium]